METFEVGLEPEIGRDLCRVGRNGKRKGYRKDILTDNLSERDAVFFCNRCQGIEREACISTDGGQFCSCCKKEDEQTHPNLRVSNMILSFKCSCPLMARGCGWLGTLRNCENHLDTCGYVYETCKLRCGVVLQRNELSVHEMEKCPQRIVECEHCNNEFTFCELHTHLDRCPKMEVSCELKCGVVMCREVMTQHLEVDCPEKAIECPYAKYKCELASIKRKYLSQHLEEKRIEHLELKLNAIELKLNAMEELTVKLNAMEELTVKQNAIELKLNAMEELTVKQNETIEKLNRTITEQSREKEKSPQRIENLENESKSTLGIANNIPSYLRPEFNRKNVGLQSYEDRKKDTFPKFENYEDFFPPALARTPATEYAFKKGKKKQNY